MTTVFTFHWIYLKSDILLLLSVNIYITHFGHLCHDEKFQLSSIYEEFHVYENFFKE